MKRLYPPRLSTAFSENGKSAKKRLAEILNTKAKRLGAAAIVLFLAATAILGASFYLGAKPRLSDPRVEEALKNHGEAPVMNSSDRAEFELLAMESLSRTTPAERENEVIRALLEKALTATDNEEKAAASGALSDRGIYLFGYESRRPSPLKEANGQMAHSVQLFDPILAFDAVNRKWTFACGGVWLDDSHSSGIFSSKVGEPDSFGVNFVFPNEKENAGIIVTDSYARISDKDGSIFDELGTKSRRELHGGFTFEMRDRLKDGKYVGYRWYGQFSCGEEFSDFSAVAANAFYTHSSEKDEFNLISNDLKL